MSTAQPEETAQPEKTGEPEVVLDLDLPSGGRVRTTWTAPAGEGRGWAWVQHGFMRSGAGLAGLAGLLARCGYAVVRPDVPSLRPTRSMHDARWLTEVALTVSRAVDVGIPQSRGIHASGAWALLGHSAGGAVAVHAAACLGARHRGADVSALLLLDPVDTVGGLLAAALPGAPRGLVHACRPSRCNRGGVTVRALADQGWPVVDHPGLAHPDPERIPASALPEDVPDAPAWLGALCGTPGSKEDVASLARQVRAALLD